MALTRRTNVPTTDSGGATSATVTVNRPSDASSGDLIVALIATTNGASETITPDQAGWTQRIDTSNNSFVSTTAGGQNIAIFSRVASGADPSSWTFTIGDSVNQWTACAIAWGDTSTPVFDGGNEGEDTSGPACATSSYTPTVVNCQVVSFFASDDNQTITWTATSASSGNSITELADHQESGNLLTISANVETQTTATATVHTATKSAGTRGAAYYIFAIQPNAPVGGGGAASGFPLLLSGFFTPTVGDHVQFILEAAFGANPSDATYTWTQVHDTDTGGYMRAAQWRRGRSNHLSPVETGTGAIVLKNTDRAWDPQNADSDFYPNVRPMLPFRGAIVIGGSTYRMFLHYADGFPRKRFGPNHAEIAVSTVDGQEGLALARVQPDKATLVVEQSGLNNDLLFTAKQPGPAGNNITIAFFETHFRPLRQQRVVITVTGTNIRVDYIDDGTVQVDEVLAALQADVATMLLVDVENYGTGDGTGDMHPLDETHLSGGDTASFPEELGGARINRCLDLAAWPSALRNVSAGQDLHGALEFPTSEDGKLLSHMQDVAGLCSENGLLFVAGDGSATFLDRVTKLTAPHNTAVAVFSDQPTGNEFAYVDAVPNESKDLVINDAVATRDGGDAQNAYDSDSVDTYWRRSKSFTSTLDTDLHVLAAVEAAVVEMGQPLQRIEQITVMPGGDLDMWQAVCQIDIGARITVVEHPPGGGSPNTDDYIVQGLNWQIGGALNSTRISYDLWPANPISNWFILDDPVRGLLDAGNRLGR